MRNRFTFSNAPTIRAKRTKFDLSFGVKSSLTVGKLAPMYVQEIYPGDSFKVDTSIVARCSSAFLRPVMDNLFLDTYFFFVPSRICYDKWAQVFGESTSEWAQSAQVDVPKLATGTVSPGTVADYMGLPLGQVPPGISVLPFRAFAKIYNDWFRDENNIDPMNVISGAISTTTERLNTSAWSPTNYMGLLPNVAKFHDYFTSCLPSPQKGDAVELTVGGVIPVNTASTTHSLDKDLVFGNSDFTFFGGNVVAPTNNIIKAGYNVQVPYSTIQGISSSSVTEDGNAYPIDVTNLVVDTSSLQQISVNDLRYGLALQRMLEADARGGSRYIEYIYSHFGVVSPDGRLQRPEYLTGARIPLNVQQVAQTSAHTEDNALGELGAYSLTNGRAHFSKSFVEHGYIIGVMALRYKHSYQQGIEKFWSRTTRTDFYDPIFANIGEQPVYSSELYANGVALKAGVFGYNEAWADLRYRPTKITGNMRTGISNSLDVWHFGDFYTSKPTLSEAFINETSTFVDRTLAVDSTGQDNFILDIYYKADAIRELPLYSIPSITEAPIYN